MLSRNEKPITMKLMEKQYGEWVNPKNVTRVTRLSLWYTFRREDPYARNMYLHNVISRWMKLQENHGEDFFRILKKLINKTKIDLTILEKHDLFLLEERAFSSERHIKVIDVNYELTPKETVGVKFVDAKLFLKEEDRLSQLGTGDLLISNRRIIINGSTNYDMKFSQIKWYKYQDYGFELNGKGNTFVIRIHDQITLNNTIENIIHKKVKNAIKKRKDN